MSDFAKLAIVAFVGGVIGGILFQSGGVIGRAIFQLVTA